jgi:hypothetical protein
MRPGRQGKRLWLVIGGLRPLGGAGSKLRASNLAASGGRGPKGRRTPVFLALRRRCAVKPGGGHNRQE